MGFLPFTQKIFLQPIPEISWLFPTFGCGYPYEIFFFSKIFVYTLWQHFWYTQYKIIFLFFALIKKIILQILVEIIFWYHEKYFQIFGILWDPLQL